MGVFARYTDQSRRAIFFAQQTALRGESTAIDSGHLLSGLLSEKGTRADIIFQLRQLLPEETTQQEVVNKRPVMKGNIPLTDDGKRILAYTAREADQLRDYWIETEHLILGILNENSSAGACKLLQVGLDLEKCRQRVSESKSSIRSGREPLWWRILTPILQPTPIGIVLQIVFLLGIIIGLVLLRN